jgi:hypothetical protein
MLQPATADKVLAHTPELRYVDPYQRRGCVDLAVCRFSTAKAGLWLAANVAWKLDRIC